MRKRAKREKDTRDRVRASRPAIVRHVEPPSLALVLVGTMCSGALLIRVGRALILCSSARFRVSWRTSTALGVSPAPTLNFVPHHLETSALCSSPVSALLRSLVHVPRKLSVLLAVLAESRQTLGDSTYEAISKAMTGFVTSAIDMCSLYSSRGLLRLISSSVLTRHCCLVISRCTKHATTRRTLLLELEAKLWRTTVTLRARQTVFYLTCSMTN